MLKANLWTKSVPRVEYDHRAREARLRFERVERLLIRNYAVNDSRPFQLLRRLAFNVSGGRRRAIGGPVVSQCLWQSVDPSATSSAQFNSVPLYAFERATKGLRGIRL